MRKYGQDRLNFAFGVNCHMCQFLCPEHLIFRDSKDESEIFWKSACGYFEQQLSDHHNTCFDNIVSTCGLQRLCLECETNDTGYKSLRIGYPDYPGCAISAIERRNAVWDCNG